MARELPWGTLAGLGLLAAAAVVVIAVVRDGTQVPGDVQPIDWHRQACAHCGMLVGEPPHAAQLITSEADVLVFDDPGCALRYLDERRPRVHRLWFHHSTAARWIDADRVRFRSGGTTPMGSGLLAVDAEEPGAVGLAAATRIAKEVR